MGKGIYLINAMAGIMVGIFVIIFAITNIIIGFNASLIGWLVAGVISVAFGIYEWKKYKQVKRAIIQ
jgi:nicotinamide riboside transporter PnuC